MCVFLLQVSEIVDSEASRKEERLIYLLLFSNAYLANPLLTINAARYHSE